MRARRGGQVERRGRLRPPVPIGGSPIPDPLRCVARKGRLGRLIATSQLVSPAWERWGRKWMRAFGQVERGGWAYRVHAYPFHAEWPRELARPTLLGNLLPTPPPSTARRGPKPRGPSPPVAPPDFRGSFARPRSGSAHARQPGESSPNERHRPRGTGLAPPPPAPLPPPVCPASRPSIERAGSARPGPFEGWGSKSRPSGASGN